MQESLDNICYHKIYVQVRLGETIQHELKCATIGFMFITIIYVYYNHLCLLQSFMFITIIYVYYNHLCFMFITIIGFMFITFNTS